MNGNNYRLIRILKKIYYRCLSMIIRLNYTHTPVLFMTLLVKNEDDILEENILFHKSMGVDGFIITDNDSSDRTMEIINKYVKRGWVKEVIIEKANDYKQQEWVDRMIRLAKDKYKADWVINADADEFWFSKINDLKNEISKTRFNVLRCSIKCVLPESDKRFWEWCYIIDKPLIKYEGLSKYSIYVPQLPKVLHRTQYYEKITMGNHGVHMKFSKKTDSSDIMIYHFAVRDLNHFVKKYTNSSLTNNPNKKAGVHWRYFYELYLNNQLEDEYAKVIGWKFMEEFIRIGVLRKDDSLVRFMHRLW